MYIRNGDPRNAPRNARPTHPATWRNTGLKSGTRSRRKIVEPVRRHFRSCLGHIRERINSRREKRAGEKEEEEKRKKQRRNSAPSFFSVERETLRFFFFFFPLPLPIKRKNSFQDNFSKFLFERLYDFRKIKYNYVGISFAFLSFSWFFFFFRNFLEFHRFKIKRLKKRKKKNKRVKFARFCRKFLKLGIGGEQPSIGEER